GFSPSGSAKIVASLQRFLLKSGAEPLQGSDTDRRAWLARGGWGRGGGGVVERHGETDTCLLEATLGDRTIVLDVSIRAARAAPGDAVGCGAQIEGLGDPAQGLRLRAALDLDLHLALEIRGQPSERKRAR